MSNSDPYLDNAEKQQAADISKDMSKPADQLEGDWLLTEPAYGKEAAPDFYQRLTALKGKAVPLFDKHGKPQLDDLGRQKYAIDIKYLWDELAYFTRDLRLGNLNNFGDMQYCEHYLDLAGDCLDIGATRSFTTAYKRVATKLELSQSKNGFFRKTKQSIYSHRTIDERPKDKKFLGGDAEQ